MIIAPSLRARSTKTPPGTSMIEVVSAVGSHPSSVACMHVYRLFYKKVVSLSWRWQAEEVVCCCLRSCCCCCCCCQGEFLEKPSVVVVVVILAQIKMIWKVSISAALKSLPLTPVRPFFPFSSFLIMYVCCSEIELQLLPLLKGSLYAERSPLPPNVGPKSLYNK